MGLGTNDFQIIICHITWGQLGLPRVHLVGDESKLGIQDETRCQVIIVRQLSGVHAGAARGASRGARGPSSYHHHWSKPLPAGWENKILVKWEHDPLLKVLGKNTAITGQNHSTCWVKMTILPPPKQNKQILVK